MLQNCRFANINHAMPPPVTRFASHRAFLLVALAASAVSPFANAIDLQPGEVTAPRPNFQFLLFSQVYSDRGDRHVDGKRQDGNPEITSSQTLVRYGRSFDLAGLQALAYVQSGVGKLRPGRDLAAQTGDSGFSDTSLALALWPYTDKEKERYLGIAGYLVLPTGDYRHQQLLNMGENRYRTALQFGYQTKLIKQLHGMAAFDAVWSGDNDEFGPAKATLEQTTLYTAQAALFYRLDGGYTLGASYFYTYGGETRVNGVDRNDRASLHRWQLTASRLFPFGRLSVQYGEDLKTANGFKEDRRWTARYLLPF